MSKNTKQKASFWKRLESKKYLVSGILIILFSLVGFTINSKNFGFIEWLKNTEKLFSPWCNLKFFALLIAVYELFLIITENDKKLSFSGSIIVAFSSCVAYNFNKIDSLVFGSIVIVLFNKLLNSENKKMNLLYTLLIIALSIMYSYTFIPFAVVFGYIFLALLIFVLIKNKEKLKEKKVYVILSILLSIIGIVYSKFIMANNYTEESMGNVHGFSLMFYYLFDCFLPFKEMNYKEFLCGMYSVAPLPIFISLYYIYKNEKDVHFLLPISVATVFEIIFCLSGFPSAVNKVLLLENISNTRMVIGVHFANLLIVYYFLSNIQEKLFSTKVNMRISIIVAILLILVSYPTIFSSRSYLTLFVLEITSLCFMFLNMEEKKYRKVLVAVILILTLISGIPAYIIM